MIVSRKGVIGTKGLFGQSGVRASFPRMAITEYTYLFNSLLTDLPSNLSGATYTRAGTKYNLQNGLYVAYGEDEFGTSYDVDNSAYGFLSEPAATNLLTYSSDYSNAVWTKSNGTMAPDVDSPESGGGSYKFTLAATNTKHTLHHSTLAGSGVLTSFDIVVKQAGYKYLGLARLTTTSSQNAWVFDLNTGTIYQNGGADYTNVAIKAVGSGWYRISANVNSATAAIRQPRWYVFSNTPPANASPDNCAFTADGTSGILFWNAQMETGSIATSPIKTVASTVTRAADVLTYALSNISNFDVTQYSLIADARSLSTTGGAASVFATLGVDEATLGYSGGNKIDCYTYSSSSIKIYQFTETITDRNKFGLSAINNVLLSSANGVSGVLQAGGTMPVSPTNLVFGSSGLLDSWNGYLYTLTLHVTNINQAALDDATS